MGEIPHAAIQEETYEYQAHTEGKMFVVTRTDIVNDDLGVIFELSQEIGRQGLRAIGDRVYQLLLSDAGTFFAALRNYISGADTVLSMESLATALSYLRTQVDADGKPVDIPVGSLVVPPQLEVMARAIINSIEIRPGTGNTKISVPTGNPLKGLATLEIEPRWRIRPFMRMRVRRAGISSAVPRCVRLSSSVS